MNLKKNSFETKPCDKDCNKEEDEEYYVSLDGLLATGEEFHCLSDGSKAYHRYHVDKEIFDTVGQLEAIYDQMKREERSSDTFIEESSYSPKEYLKEPDRQYVEYGEKIYNIRAQLAEIDPSCLFVDEQDTDQKNPSGIVCYDAKDSHIEYERMFVDSIGQFDESGTK